MTGEHRPMASRITDALLPAPDATDLPAVETTTRLRPIPATDRPSGPPTRAAAPALRPGAPAPVAAPSPPAPVHRPTPAQAHRPTPAQAAVPPRPAGPPAPAPSDAATSPSPGPAVPGARPTSSPVRSPGAAAGRPGGVPPHVTARTAAPYRGPGALPPEVPAEITTRLRPVPERRPGRTLAVAACAVLGFGLIGGALAGVWLAASEPGKPVEPVGYAEAKDLWHNAPVDTLFPRTVAGPGAGPGGADRTWTRIVVAPDAACTPAALAKALRATVEPLGCERVLRATYTDATASSVITVGLVFTRADAATQRSLGQSLVARPGTDVPPALAGPGTVAARFGAPQRAAWWLEAPADLPVVVSAVSGFADGRVVEGGPVPAPEAVGANRTDATAQSGLGHEARGITERFVRLLRTAATKAAKENAR
ncbi:hypothetical protein [Streptomyces litmocidini]|uniref:hypothetical protein n=1 Tax=Streptomyces litmocidini TaxID=67318 RepID=UPI0037009820